MNYFDIKTQYLRKHFQLNKPEFCFVFETNLKTVRVVSSSLHPISTLEFIKNPVYSFSMTIRTMHAIKPMKMIVPFYMT